MLECLLHNMAAMHRKEHRRCSHGSEPGVAQLAPEHPSMWTLLGSPDAEILKVTEWVYREELVITPSVLPSKQPDGCMRELHQELARCMARASLKSEVGAARPSSRGQRHSYSHSISQACSPSAGPQGMEVAKWLKEDAPTRQSELMRHSHSRGRDRSRWHWIPSHQHANRCQSPSPSPPMIPSCHPVAQLLYERPKLVNRTPWIQEQGMLKWCPHTSWETKDRLGLTWKGTWVMTQYCPQA